MVARAIWVVLSAADVQQKEKDDVVGVDGGIGFCLLVCCAECADN